ncbi:hypothetical protein [Haloarcula argentinensis]|uniref:Cupin 2 conserved barrel domain-containing protein n=1 Tax=Haloarcula argentinensis TaxID=43776 RepID=A0ABU2F690_HALAR|nr:hypothetical protein [Haloarcula argentinensis]EMA26340.1 hypothetical protein C443_01292 [Haloarcula argentinensis DSM 12282]MDS0255521.1 hypothetical protein [Haloarcula argentinensis]
MVSPYEIIQPAAVPIERLNTCDMEVRKLTGPLGCEEIRVNQVVVEPDSVTTPHTHDGQEEVFVATTGGRISIEGDVYDVPEGGVVRVYPDTVRTLCNHTAETHVWLAFVAPPVGTVDNFGNYVIEE